MDRKLPALRKKELPMSPRYRLAACVLAAALAPLAADAVPFTTRFPLASCNFKTHGGNAYLRLKPGRQLYLSNVRCVQENECDELEEVWITMTPETKLIKFSYFGKDLAVRTRVMEERESADGELEEISRNYVADCDPMNDVYYFGEDVTDGEGNPEDDAWLAGVDGAVPGLLMPDRAFLLGAKYFQEIAPTARDRAQHTALGLEIEVPAGTFRNCVEVTETSPLEPGEESLKVYCPGVGMVIDEELELIAVYD
jgi:hypothetical protein